MAFCSQEVLSRADFLMKTKDRNTGPQYWQSDEKRKTDAMLAKLLFPIARITSLFSAWAVRTFDHTKDPFYLHTVYHPLLGEYSIHKIQTLCADAKTKELQLTGGDSIRTLKSTKHVHPLATAAGRMLRVVSIDEAPQILYDISLCPSDGRPMWTVGPRPRTHTEYDQDLLPHRTEEPFSTFIRYLQSGLRWGGISPHIYLGRGTLSVGQQTELDLVYAERASRTSDIRLTLNLWRVPLFHRGQ